MIPNREQCYSLMERANLPEHIRDHCAMVAELATCLARKLSRAGMPIDVGLVEASALLHDIAKGICLANGKNHAEEGARLLKEWGYPDLAPIVEEHIDLEETRLGQPLTESLLVNYSDKRVKHDEVVSLEERFADLARRYGRKTGGEAYFWQRLERYRRLEERIFQDSGGGPEDLTQRPLNC
jgi:putative nucleotidyltransferase with HDIG domain